LLPAVQRGCGAGIESGKQTGGDIKPTLLLLQKLSSSYVTTQSFFVKLEEGETGGGDKSTGNLQGARDARWQHRRVKEALSRCTHTHYKHDSPVLACEKHGVSIAGGCDANALVRARTSTGSNLGLSSIY
jgi:hypothetical protein